MLAAVCSQVAGGASRKPAWSLPAVGCRLVFVSVSGRARVGSFRAHFTTYRFEAHWGGVFAPRSGLHLEEAGCSPAVRPAWSPHRRDVASTGWVRRVRSGFAPGPWRMLRSHLREVPTWGPSRTRRDRRSGSTPATPDGDPTGAVRRTPATGAQASRHLHLRRHRDRLDSATSTGPEGPSRRRDQARPGGACRQDEPATS